MRIKRFFAADMRQAIRLVRNEQGPEAVILSSRAVNNGIEIISAMDYDQNLVTEMVQTAEKNRTSSPSRDNLLTSPGPANVNHNLGEDDDVSQDTQTPLQQSLASQVIQDSPLSISQDKIKKPEDPALTKMQQELADMKGLLREQLSQIAWGNYSRNHPIRAQHIKRLSRLGFSHKIAKDIADSVQEVDDPVKSWREVLYRIAKITPLAQHNIMEQGGTIALVGPTGVGKTTTLAKLAARFALRHGRDQVALVNVDTYRIGAQKQLQTYGQILGVPVMMTRLDELNLVLEGVADKKLILIDTAGLGPRDPRNKKRFSLYSKISSISTYLTLAANTQPHSLDEVARAFAPLDLKGCVLTKLDEASNLGDALSVIIGHHLPLVYLSDGQRVPEDLHPVRISNLLTQAVSLARRFHSEIEEESPAWPMRVPRAQEVGISA
jgi:flagellar biosynthesis protein FlhF